MKMMNQNLLFGYFGPKFWAGLGKKKKKIAKAINFKVFQ